MSSAVGLRYGVASGRVKRQSAAGAASGGSPEGSTVGSRVLKSR